MSDNTQGQVVRRRVPVGDMGLLREVCGPQHSHLALIENALGLRVESLGGDIELIGEADAIERGLVVVSKLVARAQRGETVGTGEVRAEILFASKPVAQGVGTRIILPGRRGIVDARTPMQSQYLDALLARESPSLVFGVGPAGTGKTFLAVAAGVAALLEGKAGRLVVTRPAVEAGERLGFLPGDMNEKVDPYLMPIWDALKGLLGAQQLERRRGAGEIEVAPLAFMRGRTLSDAFVIVDEAQNATEMQMKMVLTRLGEGARMVVTGDPTQVDLPRDKPSGLVQAIRILDGVDGVAMIHFGTEDVVRHPLVGRIVAAYERETARQESKPRFHRGPGSDE